MTSDTVRPALVALLVVISACAGSTPATAPTTTASSSSSTTAGQPATPPASTTAVAPAGASLALEVTDVIDGDSLRGRGAGQELEIRLVGVNAPEGDECLGDAARQRLEELLTVGPVELRPWPAERDEFGRTLGLLTAGDVFVNLALLESGHAVARAQSEHPFRREFEAVEAAAAAGRRGLWAEDACGPPAGSQVEIVELMANAPGDDRQNPNGEFVVIENRGDADVDLEGWMIRDESTRHRFVFPAVVLEPGQRARLRSGCGDNELGANPLELFWCDAEPPIWNNDGDTAFLLDFAGNTVDFLRS